MAVVVDQVTSEPRRCARKRCGAPALEDSDLCAPCALAKAQQVATGMQALRDRRRTAGQCRDCGKPCAKPTKDPNAPYPRCKACRILAGRFMAQGSGVVTGMVTKSGSHTSRISLATRVDGTGRTRYHGQQKRGKPSAAATVAAAMQVIEKESRLAAGATALAFAPGSELLPRIQRDEAKHAALALWKLVAREILDMCVRNGVEVDDVKPSEADD